MKDEAAHGFHERKSFLPLAKTQMAKLAAHGYAGTAVRPTKRIDKRP
jgi:hypothetical protein